MKLTSRIDSTGGDPDRTEKLIFDPRSDLKIVTFDSGAGGCLITASLYEIACKSAKKSGYLIEIQHIGDTLNLPYGNKTGAEVANFTLKALNRAFEDGADKFFIACNTASTEAERIRSETEKIFPGKAKDVISVTELSRFRLFRLCDKILASGKNSVNILILATERTIKSRLYPSFLASYYGTLPTIIAEESFTGGFAETISAPLPTGGAINITQVALYEWVNHIENGSENAVIRRKIREDLSVLSAIVPPDERYNMICYFCTHYPFLHHEISVELQRLNRADPESVFVMQATEAADFLTEKLYECSGNPQDRPLQPQPLPFGSPKIFLTGASIRGTENLIKRHMPSLTASQVTGGFTLKRETKEN